MSKYLKIFENYPVRTYVPLTFNKNLAQNCKTVLSEKDPEKVSTPFWNSTVQGRDTEPLHEPPVAAAADQLPLLSTVVCGSQDKNLDQKNSYEKSKCYYFKIKQHL